MKREVPREGQFKEAVPVRVKTDVEIRKEKAATALCIDTLLGGPEPSIGGAEDDESPDGISLLREHFYITDREMMLDMAMQDPAFRRKYLCVEFSQIDPSREDSRERYLILLGRLLEMFKGKRLEDITGSVEEQARLGAKLKQWNFDFGKEKR